jgi:hypothetical protein
VLHGNVRGSVCPGLPGSDQNKRRGVRFGGGGDEDSSSLAEIIGYSDSKPFAVNVGPVAVDDSTQGKFQDLVKPTMVDAAPAAKGQRESQKGTQDEFRKYMAERKSLVPALHIYDTLPPPSKQ